MPAYSWRQYELDSQKKHIIYLLTMSWCIGKIMLQIYVYNTIVPMRYKQNRKPLQEKNYCHSLLKRPWSVSYSIHAEEKQRRIFSYNKIWKLYRNCLCNLQGHRRLIALTLGSRTATQTWFRKKWKGSMQQFWSNYMRQRKQQKCQPLRDKTSFIWSLGWGRGS